MRVTGLKSIKIIVFRSPLRHQMQTPNETDTKKDTESPLVAMIIVLYFENVLKSKIQRKYGKPVSGGIEAL